MRQLAVIVFAITLLWAGAAWAQSGSTGLYVFVGNPEYTRTDLGSSWTGAYGVALQRMFTAHLSGEVTVSRQSNIATVTIFSVDRPPVTELRTKWVTPVDLTARYHFSTDNSWKPYAGVGARWVGPPSGLPAASRAMLAVTGGVVWQFRPALGLRLDSKLMLARHPAFVDRSNTSAGLAWRF